MMHMMFLTPADGEPTADEMNPPNGPPADELDGDEPWPFEIDLRAECLAHAVDTMDLPAATVAVLERARSFYDWVIGANR